MQVDPVNPTEAAEVLVTRGGVVESVHRVAVAVVGANGALAGSAGDFSQLVFFRSAAKPFQALPLVEDGIADRLPLTEEELALCCASHSGEPRHLSVARSILEKAGLGEDALACGPHMPFDLGSSEALLANGERPRRIHNNCSGKHAGMLALARAHGWPTDGYQRAEHPLQRRMLAEVSRWTGVDAPQIETGVDGCGVLCFAVSLEAMARSFARFASAAALGEPASRVVGAMTRHAFMVGGSGRLCTALMEVAGDRVFVKTGAEGVYCAGIPAAGVGVALKALDGGKRAAEAAIVRVLEEVGVLRPDEVELLRPFARPEVLNTRSETVGEVTADFRLQGRGRAGFVVSGPVPTASGQV